MRLYSGADYKGHIEGVYHQNSFPGSWQSDRFPFTIYVGSNGTAEYEIHYVDIEDLETQHTVNASEDTTFQVGNGFNIAMHFKPYPSYLVDKVIFNYYDRDDNFLYTETYPNITQKTVYNYHNRQNYDHIKCAVTFK